MAPENVEPPYTAVQDQPAADLLTRRERSLSSSYRLFYTHPVEAVRGSRAHLFDAAGNDYLDMYNNVPAIGHGNSAITAAVAAQAAKVNTHTRYLSEGIVSYAESLLATFPAPLDRVTFALSGSEAVDLALRMARFHTGHDGVIVTSHAYHGTTSAAAAVSPSLGPDNPLGASVRTVQPPAPNEPAGVFAARVSAAVESLEAAGFPVAALLVDSIMSSDGVLPGPLGALPAAAAVVRARGGVWIADEVQPGFGRTGVMWGFARHADAAASAGGDDFAPDIVVLGKPMGNGMPISAVVHRHTVGDEFGRKVRYFNTFGGNPVSIAAAQVVLDTVITEDLAARAARLGDELAAGVAVHSQFSQVRHAGLFLGADLPDAQAAQRVVDGLREHRVLVSASGAAGNVLKVRPPLIISEDDIARFHSALSTVLTTLPTGS